MDLDARRDGLLGNTVIRAPSKRHALQESGWNARPPVRPSARRGVTGLPPVATRERKALEAFEAGPRIRQEHLAPLYPCQYTSSVKVLRFLGDSLKCLREFPKDARHDAGYQLDKVQRGEQPDDSKPMPSIGKGVEEIRIWDATGIYRVVYTARLAAAVYVLHAFQKKTQSTTRRDIELAKKRFVELMRGAQ